LVSQQCTAPPGVSIVLYYGYGVGARIYGVSDPSEHPALLPFPERVVAPGDLPVVMTFYGGMFPEWRTSSKPRAVTVVFKTSNPELVNLPKWLPPDASNIVVTLPATATRSQWTASFDVVNVFTMCITFRIELMGALMRRFNIREGLRVSVRPLH
jgi:hypothetical protein